jgi:hypothetical protein
MKTGDNPFSEKPRLNRRGFVTNALGAVVFATAAPSREQTIATKQPDTTPESKKIFIAMPGGLYYAVPEEALQQYKVGTKQFEAELAAKQQEVYKLPPGRTPGPIVIHYPKTVLGVRG